ncbi:MAG: peptidase dimerization domain protein [Candidatus Aminicenantes bacterium]|nr:peptidase dimerization domain protein [Candidatus Aminicenantes bacterium]
MDFNLFFKSRQGEMVHLLKNIVGRESPSHDKKAVDACSAFVVGEFRKTGAKVTRFPQKEVGDLHLIEFAGPSRPASDGRILVLTHIDTVWPVGKVNKMPFYISGDKVYGPGVLDMKGGLVEAVSAFKAIHQLSLRPARKIALFINSAEEIGHEASHEIIARLAGGSKIVLCLEPALPGGALKTQRKGRIVVRIDVKGKAAHAGTPEKGVNAIEELAVQIHRLRKLATAGATVSVNMAGGGEKANVVAEAAWAVMDIRFWSTVQKEKIIGAFKHLRPERPGARFKFEIGSQTPPMEKTRPSVLLFQQAKKIAEAMEINLTQGRTGGGSDASIASGMGVATLDGLGPDGDGIHAENEHLLLSSLVQRTALLTELLRQL